MLRGLYTTAAAMNAAAVRQDVVSRNLAHVNVPGFKRTEVVFKTFRDVDQSANPQRGSRTPEASTDFSMGPLSRTGRSLDFAIAGDGFFTVEGPNGLLFTRNGSFHRSPEGELVTSSGHRVSGSPSIPLNLATEDIQVTANGTITANGQELGQLEIASFADNSQLIPVGTTLFAAPGNMPPGDSDALIQQGMQERSNVNSVIEMVQMISGMRHHEANSKALQMITEAIQKHTTAN